MSVANEGICMTPTAASTDNARGNLELNTFIKDTVGIPFCSLKNVSNYIHFFFLVKLPIFDVMEHHNELCIESQLEV